MSAFIKHAAAALVSLMLLLFNLPAAASAGQVVQVDAREQFGYAESLYAGGDYLLAAGEYKRFEYLFPDHDSAETAAFKVGMCYLKAGRYPDAIASFKDYMRRYPEGRHYHASHFKISGAYVASGQTGAAIATLQNLVVVAEDVDVRDEARYRMGWIYIGMAQWEKAQEAFAHISAENSGAYRCRELSARLAEEEKEIPRKSPKLAGSLALLPGGGYLYCGRYQDALAAFFVNGGLIWAAYEAFDNELYALGSVITFVEIGFYAGSIYGSVASAHKYNRRNERRWIERLRQQLKVKLAARYENRGVELSFNYTF